MWTAALHVVLGVRSDDAIIGCFYFYRVTGSLKHMVMLEIATATLMIVFRCVFDY